jgi:hypothetical protein
MHFNRQYYEGEAGQRLATYMDQVTVPVFTKGKRGLRSWRWSDVLLKLVQAQQATPNDT